MIESIKFDGKYGYIISKIPEPGCYVRGMEWRKDFTKEEKDAIKQYKKDMKMWEKHKDDLRLPHLYKNLMNKEFKFTNGINIIFGANASGKTTILKALAGNAGTTDGYTKMLTPSDIKDYRFDEDMTDESVRKSLNSIMGNSAEIKWDGSPIYYHNFENRANQGYIGEMAGSVLGNSLGTEIMYRMTKNKISMGQNSLYLLNRLYNIAKNNTCFASIFSKYITNGKIDRKKIGMNDTWNEAYYLQLKYYLSFPKSFVESPSTFLFDEIDKSMDILNVHSLYTNYLPALVEQTGIQIILVSHSPIVLSKQVREHPLVNFISVDDKYTEECLKIF